MYLRQIIKKLYKELFRFIPALIWSFSKIQPTNIQIVNPPKGNMMLLVKKSIKLKKSKPKNDTSFQILNEKILPKPNTQAIKPKIITPHFRVNIFCSSTQAVKGSIKDTDELTAAMEIRIKKIDANKLPKGKELKATGKVSNNNPGPEETDRIGLLKTIGKIVNPANNATEVSRIIIMGIVLPIGWSSGIYAP